MKALNSPPPGDPARDVLAHDLNTLRSPHYCGNTAVVGRSPDGRIVHIAHLHCGTWHCDYCAQRLAWAWRFRIEAAKPTRWFTLTCNEKAFANPYDAIHAFEEAFPALVRRIRKDYGAFEYVRILELHENGMPHFHVAYRGSYIRQPWLSYHWRTLAKSPNVWIGAIHRGQHLGRYLTKYLVKNASSTSLHFRHHRVITASRDFFPDDPPDPRYSKYFGWTWKIIRTPAGDVGDYLVLNCGCTILSADARNGLELLLPDDRSPPPTNDPDMCAIRVFLFGANPCDPLTPSRSDSALPSSSPRASATNLTFASLFPPLKAAPVSMTRSTRSSAASLACHC